MICSMTLTKPFLHFSLYFLGLDNPEYFQMSPESDASASTSPPLPPRQQVGALHYLPGNRWVHFLPDNRWVHCVSGNRWEHCLPCHQVVALPPWHLVVALPPWQQVGVLPPGNRWVHYIVPGINYRASIMLIKCFFLCFRRTLFLSMFCLLCSPSFVSLLFCFILACIHLLFPSFTHSAKLIHDSAQLIFKICH